MTTAFETDPLTDGLNQVVSTLARSPWLDEVSEVSDLTTRPQVATFQCEYNASMYLSIALELRYMYDRERQVAEAKV